MWDFFVNFLYLPKYRSVLNGGRRTESDSRRFQRRLFLALI